MAIIVWDNSGGDGLWETATNWVGNVAPGTNDVATFDATSVANCTIQNSISVLGIDIQSTYSGTITQSITSGGITVGASGFTIDAGAFVCTDTAFDLSGDYTQTGGTFTATSGVMKLTRDWNKTAGTFNNNNGQLNLQTVGSPHQIMTNSAVETFYQFRVSKGAFDVSLVTSNIQVSNRLIVSNSATASSPQLSGKIVMIGTAILEQNGNWYDGTLGEISFEGTNHEWIQNNTDGKANMPAITINCTDLKLTVGTAGNSFGSWSWDWQAGTITNSATSHFKNNQTSKHNTFKLFQTLTIGQLTSTLGNFDLKINDELGTGPATLAVDGDISLNGISSGTQFLGIGSTLSLTGNYSQDSSAQSSAGQVRLLFNGTGDQTVNVPNDHTIPALTVEVDKATGKLTLLDSLDQKISAYDFTLTNGDLDLNGFDLSAANDMTLNDTVFDLAGSIISAGGDFVAANTDLIGATTWQLNVTGSSVITGGTVTNCEILPLGGVDLFAFTSVDGGGNDVGVLFVNLVVRYVNTAAAAGGTGRTNASAGQDRAYSGFAEMEAAEQTDLVTLTVRFLCLCSGAIADPSSSMGIAGWTTNVNYYITIEANPNTVDGFNPSRAWSDSHYRIGLIGSQTTLTVQEIYTRLIGLQIQRAGGNGRSLVYFLSGGNSLADKLKLRMNGANTGWSGIRTHGNSGGTCIRNCVIDGLGNTSFTAILMDSTTDIYIFNNTFVNGTTGIKSTVANNIIAKNNLVYNCTLAYDGTFDVLSDYNSTDNAETTGGANDRQSQTFTFENAAGGDYGLLGTDTGALNHGVDLATDPNCPVVVDNINVSRPQGAAYDIGAFEMLIAGVGKVKVFISARLNKLKKAFDAWMLTNSSSNDFTHAVLEVQSQVRGVGTLFTLTLFYCEDNGMIMADPYVLNYIEGSNITDNNTAFESFVAANPVANNFYGNMFVNRTDLARNLTSFSYVFITNIDEALAPGNWSAANDIT